MMPDRKADCPTAERRVDYERTDASIRVIAYSALTLFAITGVASLGMYGLFEVLREFRMPEIAPTTPFAERRQTPPEPRLQTDPTVELTQLRRYEHELLSTYRWVDREQGVVAIPIDRAIDLLVQREGPNGNAQANDTP